MDIERELLPAQRQQVSTFDETLVDGIAQFVARWTNEKLGPVNERLTELDAIAELRRSLMRSRS